MPVVKYYFGWYLNARGRRCSVSWVEEDGVPLGAFDATVVQIKEVPEQEVYDLDLLEEKYPYVDEKPENNTE